MNGVLLVDKPAGLSSAEVVRQIKRRLRRARVGHLGTLDPFATGLLPILIAEATKLAPFLQQGAKEYAGMIVLGVETDTLDPEGMVTRSAPLPADLAPRLEAARREFIGRILQRPPLFSAIKRGGVPLYRLARRGIAMDAPAARPVEIEELQLTLEEPARIHFRMVCSGGTYVRSLARDLGERLGTVAHLGQLRRLRSGAFRIEEAKPLAEVVELLDSGTTPALIGLTQALGAMAETTLSRSEAARLRTGDARPLAGRVPAGTVRFKITCGGELVAVAESDAAGIMRLLRVFHPSAAAPPGRSS